MWKPKCSLTRARSTLFTLLGGMILIVLLFLEIYRFRIAPTVEGVIACLGQIFMLLGLTLIDTRE